MNPMIRVVRSDRPEWTERRFFDLLCVRKITSKQAGMLDLRHVRYYKTLPTKGTITYVPVAH